MDRMRKLIADHMVRVNKQARMCKFTEANMTNLVVRDKMNKELKTQRNEDHVYAFVH
jgi:hypothetical protein